MSEYRVVGVLNAFDVWPCFLQVVFSFDNNLYFQIHSKDKIDGFEKIRTEISIDERIIPINYDVSLKKGDPIISAVGFGKDDIIVGTVVDIVCDFAKNKDKYSANQDFFEDVTKFVIEYGI